MTGWSLSCPDWRERIRDGRSLVPDLPLIKSEADEALGFFNDLRVPDLPGLPRMEEAAGDWFKEIVRVAYGSYDRNAGERVSYGSKKRQGHRFIKEIFVLAPKGASKTTYAAGLGLTALLMNTRKRAELLIVAETQAVSFRAYELMVGMIEEDRQLETRFHPRSHSGNYVIEDRVLGANLRIKSFDLSILTGSKPIWVLLDELHLLARMSSASKVMVQIRNGLLKNPEGLLITLTTQSDQAPRGVFLDELTKARAIRDGEVVGETLPILYEFPEDIASDQTKWQDPTNWHMVLPNLGRSQRLPDIVSSFRAEQSKGEAALQIWASQQLNIQVGVGLRPDGWAGAKIWDRGIYRDAQGRSASLTLRDLLEQSEVCTVGADGGGLDDLFGVAVIGRHKVTKQWLVWTHAFVSPEGMERRAANAGLYEAFVADGDLTLVEELPQDVEGVVDIVRSVKDAGLLAAVGTDRWGIGGLVDALAEIGVTNDSGLLGAISQGGALQGAIKTVERKLADGSLKHGGQAMMAWCASNAIIVPTPTGMRIARDATGFGKIDPLMALFNAADLMAMNPQASQKTGRLDDFLARPVAA